jgi:hypothetical protein
MNTQKKNFVGVGAVPVEVLTLGNTVNYIEEQKAMLLGSGLSTESLWKHTSPWKQLKGVLVLSARRFLKNLWLSITAITLGKSGDSYVHHAILGLVIFETAPPSSNPLFNI